MNKKYKFSRFSRDLYRRGLLSSNLGYYSGSYSNSKPSGKGEYIFKNSFFKYEGEYNDGKFHGNGKLYFGPENSDYYEGL
jgi:hypothetical protein